MNRQEIERDYKVDERGIIRDPGKFEGEMVYSPYFYDLIMDGGSDQTDYDGDTEIDYFDMNAKDRKEFPELADVEQVRCWETDNGFFYCEVMK